MLFLCVEIVIIPTLPTKWARIWLVLHSDYLILKIIIMRTSYTSFPSNSKVWVFQSSRLLTESDFETIKKYTDTFLENWDSHGKIEIGRASCRERV